jgi:PAS domain S-box-containing protein
MTRARILVVESDKHKGLELQNYLMSMGYEVVGIAASGSEALECAARLHPDLVLMDMQMKGETNGVEAGEIILSRFEIPLIYLIAHTGEATLQRSKATRPFGYIFEPLDDKHALATIEVALLRNRLEKQLRESQQWLSTVLNSIGDGVLAVDEQARITFINPIAEALTGWQASEAVTKPLYQVFSIIDENSRGIVDIASAQDKAASTNDPQTNIVAILSSRTGNHIPVEITMSPIQKAGDAMGGMVLVFRDITERRRAMAEIKLQASRAEALVHVASQLNEQVELGTLLETVCIVTNRTLRATGTAVFLADPRTDIFRNMAYYSEEPLLSVHQGDHFEIRREVFESVVSRENPVVVIRDLRAFGGLPYLDFLSGIKINTMAIAALFIQEQLTGTLISVFGESQRAISEDDNALLKGLADQASSAIANAELFEQIRTGRERQRVLAKSLVDVQEAERRHIARELHDHLGQSLTGLQFMLESTKKQVDDAQKSSLEEIQKYTADILGQVREMSLNLRPSMLDDLGLLPTLQWHFDRYLSQTGICVHLQTNDFHERFPITIETTIYRIIQEALTNAARYSGAKDVFVRLEEQAETLWLEVLDKGVGFDPLTVVDRPTSGLGGMRERAGLVGGYLTVDSEPGQGTRILAALPSNEKPLERRHNDRYRAPGG